MQLCGIQLSSALKVWIEAEGQVPGRSRTDLARRTCERLGLVDARGDARVVTARIDLARLARSGDLELPAAMAGPPAPPARPLPRPKVRKQSQPARELEDLGELTVHRVQGPSDPAHAKWRKALEEHHYLGSGPICGAQIRYVVRAGRKVVAVASFSSPALKVAARDEHIGWTPSARRRNRARVVQQSRFCVTIDVPNLATHVLGLLQRRVADDWFEAYRVRPVLIETYVDTARFAGTCYLAANWECVGRTSGRGRQDRTHRADKSIKSIWLHPLDPEWKRILSVEPPREIDPAADWAEVEWGSVDLGDKRLTRRLVKYGSACFARPTSNTPGACGSRAAMKGAYRLLNHESASLDTFLSGHREATIARAAQHPVVLALQDTTSLNYSGHFESEGLGPIGTAGAMKTRGLLVHGTFLVTPSGLPLGLLDVNAWARKPEEWGKAKERYKLSIEEKESFKWIRGYLAADEMAERIGSTQVVVVGDRESDIYELFEAADQKRAQVLVRACWSRKGESDEGLKFDLWKSVKEQAPSGHVRILVGDPDKKNQRREALLEVRFHATRIAKPVDKKGAKKSLPVVAIAATEVTPEIPESDRIEWLLLTTVPTDTVDDAIERLTWYTRRWLIEVFHRTLKSGCKVEKRQAHRAKTLMAALAIDAVVAWRVMMLVKLGRETPDVPCSTIFEESEWKALWCFTHRTNTPPTEEPTLRDALRMVASLGGFLGRKCDGEPGAETTWRGMERLSDIHAAYTFFLARPPPP